MGHREVSAHIHQLLARGMRGVIVDVNDWNGGVFTDLIVRTEDLRPIIQLRLTEAAVEALSQALARHGERLHSTRLGPFNREKRK